MTRFLRLFILLIVFFTALPGCAAPRAEQGQGQGGSVGTTPTVTVTVTIGGQGAPVTVATSPTAAPAATSAAQASQTATNDVKPAVGTDAIKALSHGYRLDSGKR